MSLYQRSFFTGIGKIFSLPKLSIPLILTLGLTLGAVLTVIAISSSLLLKPLQGINNEEKIKTLSYKLVVSEELHISYWNFRRLTGIIEQYGDLGTWGAISAADETIRINNVNYAITSINASNTILDVLGAKLLLGEDVTKQDPEDYVWISYSLWQTAFSGLDSAIGKQIAIGEQTKIVAGVIEDVMAIDSDQKVLAQQTWRIHNLEKLQKQPETTNITGDIRSLLLKAQNESVQLPSHQELNEWIRNYIAQNVPAEVVPIYTRFIENNERTYDVENYRDTLIGDSKTLIVALFCAVVGLLVMATLNLLNLFIAHYQSRTKEFAIQLSLGASLFKMRTMVMLENLPSFILAAVSGIIVAGWVIKSLPVFAGDSLPMLETIHIDAYVIITALIVVLLLNVLFSVIALLDINKESLNDNLASSGKGIQAQSNQGVSRALMIIQLAIASILLTASAMLAMHSFKFVYKDLGYTLDNLHRVTAEIKDQAWLESLSDFENYQSSEIKAYKDRVSETLESIIPNSRVIIADEGAISDSLQINMYIPEDQPDKQIMFQNRGLSHEFFEAFEIPFLAGKNLTAEQIAQNEQRVVIDDTFAKLLFPELTLDEIVGKTIKFGNQENKREAIINGIVAASPTQPGLAQNNFPGVFFANLSVGERLSFIIKKSDDEPLSENEIIQVLQQSFPRLDEFEVQSLDDMWLELTLDTRVSLAVVLAMTGLTLLLAAIGVAGLTQMTTNHRKYELAVRMATGAKQWSLVNFILKDALVMLMLGLGIGFIVSVFAYDYIQQQLSMLPSFDWYAMAILDTGLITIVILSVLIPAWQIIKQDPMQALREE